MASASAGPNPHEGGYPGGREELPCADHAQRGWHPRFLVDADAGAIGFASAFLWACELGAVFPVATRAVGCALIPKAGVVFRRRRPIAVCG